MSAPLPSAIDYRAQSRLLVLDYASGERFELPAEYLRVHSPSAEVRGHGKGQEVLQIGKLNVAIRAIEPVGHYAIKLIFDDGHDSGIYSWETLYDLGQHHERNWAAYLARLEQAGQSREPAPTRYQRI